MEIFNILDPEEFRLFCLVLARISLVLFMLPIFSAQMLPRMVKASLALILSLLLFSVVEADPARFPDGPVETALLLISEAMIGLTLGLCVRLFFGSVQLAGQVIGFQMGFSMINVVDPQSGANVSIMEQLGYWVTLLVFLCLNGHHALILSLIESFRLVPMGGFMFQDALFHKVLSLGGQMFLLAVKIGAPVIAALLFTSAGFGLTAKFSPQMNVMIVAFPLKIFIGLALFGLSLNVILLLSRTYVGELKPLFMNLMFWMGGG